ncbi:MAG: hypothetical protein CMA41_00255 [Euryarchaeota archaeon]|jgi:hypothetical protein|nr:hypothetical protein [Euryarchaeota archaeon]CAI8320501.1 MAG: Uncharacterised protein [Euryarchaeota archaeon UBA443]|tara:strand:- start:23320 stop:24756 length:1437 start_codon:yes stop_codon:yes gene_type:complete
MQTRGRNERLAESGEKMVLHGLRVAGESGRARASLGDSRLSIEFKNGNCIDIRYDRIVRMQHHNTTLIPSWVAFIGLCFLYASWRVITPPDMRLLGLAIGISMISGWVLTKRPTLTLDTELGDCHVLHAIDSRLLKLSTMIQRMNDGLTLEEARLGVDLLNEDTEFPRQSAHDAAQAIPAPMQDLEPARSLTHFLNETMPENDEFEIDEVLPRWAKDTIDQELTLFDELDPQQHGIIERGIANVGTRRGHTSPLDIHSNRGPGQISNTQFLGDAPLPIPMHQPPMSSSQMIQEATGRAREPEGLSLTPIPTRHLPSFVGPDGAHIPSTPDAFTSPDLPLFNPEIIEAEQVPSLVEQGMISQNNIPVTTSNSAPRIRRNARGKKKRLQPRTSPKRRIASSRRQAEQDAPRRFSSIVNKIQDRISKLREHGIDEEIIERMGEHIPEEEEENQVPSSFSALTESQETAPVQTSQHGLRRID